MITLGPNIIINPDSAVGGPGDYEVLLSQTQFRLFVLVARAKYGITPERLLEILYADDPDGGPDTGRRAVCVRRVITN
jgi:hypothetical protein